jgi:hypothetical protein
MGDTFHMVHMNVGGKNVFEIELILLDVGHQGIDGTTDVNKSRFSGLGIIQEITVGIDRSGHLVKDGQVS